MVHLLQPRAPLTPLCQLDQDKLLRPVDGTDRSSMGESPSSLIAEDLHYHLMELLVK